jgi:hypothetical protein
MKVGRFPWHVPSPILVMYILREKMFKIEMMHILREKSTRLGG